MKLSKVEEKSIIDIILKRTRMVNGFYDFENDSEVKEILNNLNLSEKNVYICISPILKFKLKDDHHRREYKIDLRNHKEGNSGCDHTFFNMYWENSRSSLDGGYGHNYNVCDKCGYHEDIITKKLLLLPVRFCKILFNILFKKKDS